jgi:hypothetical protein
VTNLSALAAVFLYVVLCHLLRRCSRGSRNGHCALHSRRDGLHVSHELGIQRDVEAVCTGSRAGSVDGVDDHAKDRESGSFDIGSLGLTSPVTASMVEELAWAVFRAGRTLVSTNFATFTVSLAAAARACSTLVINAVILFASSPGNARAWL